MKKWKWIAAFFLCVLMLITIKLEDSGYINTNVRDFIYGSKDLQIMRNVLKELIDEKRTSTITVSSNILNEELLSYNQVEPFESGFLFTYDKQIPILAINDGLVVYTGHSKKLGKVISIYYDDEITVTYGFIDSFSILPYTNIEKGKLIAKLESNDLYIRVEKDNRIYDLKETLLWLKESVGAK